MKKFLALIIILFSLSSCGGNTDENTDEENSATGTKLENSETGAQIEDEVTPEISTDEKEPINNKNEGAVTPNKQNTPTEKPQNNGTVSNTSSGTADEKVLEKEVNDLLDEFIDSLDSYEK